MRLFFALWPEDEVREALAGWAAACRQCVRGRATRTENLHATLAFLGEVAASDVARLAALAASLPCQRFELTLDRLQYWPRKRIVLAGCTRTPDALASLAQAMRAGLSQAGFRVEDRDYVPHVTLLRDARSAPDAVAVDPLPWRVQDIVLVESVRSHGTLRYRPIQRFTLAI